MKLYEKLNIDQMLNLKRLEDCIMNTGNTWISPNNEYGIVFSRRLNQLWNTTREYDFNYGVSIDIYDTLGVLITSINTTEYGIIELVYDLLSFTDFDFAEFQTYSSYTIGFDPSVDLSEQRIIVQRVPIMDDENTINYYSSEYNEYREILFKIEKSSPIYNRIEPVVTFNVSDSELINLCLVCYTSILIDLDIGTKYMSEIEYITQRICEVYDI